MGLLGEGEWLENKYKVKVKRKRWRKLHLGLDLVSGEIICFELTTDDVGDPTALPDLLDQIAGPVSRFIADGAYDGAPTRDLLETRLGEVVEIVYSASQDICSKSAIGAQPNSSRLPHR